MQLRLAFKSLETEEIPPQTLSVEWVGKGKSTSLFSRPGTEGVAEIRFRGCSWISLSHLYLKRATGATCQGQQSSSG